MALSKVQRCIVTRSYRHRGVNQGVGTILDHDTKVAVELKTANKVEYMQSDTPLEHHEPVSAPKVVSIDSASQLKASKKALSEAAALSKSADNANEEADKKLAEADEKIAAADETLAKAEKLAQPKKAEKAA